MSFDRYIVVYNCYFKNMKSALFTYDTPTYKDVNGVYCSTTLTNEILVRYTQDVDIVYVATRVNEINIDYREAHLSKIDLKKVVFIDLPDFNVLKYRRSRIKLVRRIIEKKVEEVDYLYLRLPSTTSNIAAFHARQIKKPYLAELGGCPFDSLWNYRWYTKPLAVLSYFSLSKIMKEAAYATYVTKYWLQQRYRCNCPSLVSSNVRLDIIDENSLERRLQKIQNMDINQPLVLGTAAGINVRYKGQHLVIKAISQMKKKGIIIKYELAGDGDDSFLRFIAKKYNVVDQVFFVGRKTHDEILEWLDSIDLYIQPSLQEGLPRAVLEAMSRACPVLGSSTAGIPELIDKECIFRRGSVTAISKSLNNISKEKIEKWAKNNFFEAKKYLFSVLEHDRNLFFKEYINTVNNEKL